MIPHIVGKCHEVTKGTGTRWVCRGVTVTEGEKKETLKISLPQFRLRSTAPSAEGAVLGQFVSSPTIENIITAYFVGTGVPDCP